MEVEARVAFQPQVLFFYLGISFCLDTRLTRDEIHKRKVEGGVVNIVLK